MGLDSFFQKILMITPKELTGMPGDTFEDMALKP
jgi:hypothetical protein